VAIGRPPPAGDGGRHRRFRCSSPNGCFAGIYAGEGVRAGQVANVDLEVRSHASLWLEGTINPGRGLPGWFRSATTWASTACEASLWCALVRTSGVNPLFYHFSGGAKRGGDAAIRLNGSIPDPAPAEFRRSSISSCRWKG